MGGAIAASVNDVWPVDVSIEPYKMLPSKSQRYEYKNKKSKRGKNFLNVHVFHLLWHGNI